MTEAMFYEKRDGKCFCKLCPHFCVIPPGARGRCGVRGNKDGVLEAESYGKLTAIALDPIEKKPLRMFGQGMILSVGSYGCNFRCGFCQNYHISFGSPETTDINDLTPEAICALAVKYRGQGNIGVAYTYNEPFMSYEFVYDCARSVKDQGLKNVLVTNGFVNPEPLEQILPFIDALNIDLKSFDAEFYNEIGGEIEAVKNTIKLAAKHAHVEVTTLIIPEKNDSPDEMDALAVWLAEISPEIPLHITRFRPMHKYSGHKTATAAHIAPLKAVAEKYLKHVFAF
ncbi:MAG: AmmeMemoRadiSam system radical SAM enzyme [Defluviitaleaceae bacterium]|nr:AmmeMemoRadiSam system radical SAM enzyme [Defluviitaleaceae bacterium]